MSTVRIDVTREDIVAGSRANCFRCPIALAFRRVTSITNTIQVLPTKIDLGSGKYAELPEAAIDWIRDYDAYGVFGVEPFSFDIELPEAA